MGKASTSVGPSASMKRWLSSAMAASSTNSSESSASPWTPSATSTSCARATQRSTSTTAAFCSSAPNTCTSPSGPRRAGRGAGRWTSVSSPGRDAPGGGISGGFTASRLGLGGARLVGALVGVDDVLDDVVTHHVLGRQANEGQAVDVAQHPFEVRHAAAPGGQVDLGHVGGHHCLRPEPDAGQEHLHLLGGRVLGLVQDDEALVERAPPHE